jgi:hypothetical protein
MAWSQVSTTARVPARPASSGKDAARPIVAPAADPEIVSVVSPAPRTVWRLLMATDPEALPYQSPEWLDSQCAVTGARDASRLYEFADGSSLLMPAVEERRGGIRHRSSQPDGWGMGGCLRDVSVDHRHYAAVFADLARPTTSRCRIRPNPRNGSDWANGCPPGVLRIPRLAHCIDLRPGFDHLWTNGFSRTTRRSVRRAERAGVEIESDSTGRLALVFYDLLLRSVGRWADRQNEPRWMARWRARRRDPLAKFEAIARTMDGQCKFWVAWHEGQPVAASMVLMGANVNDARAVMDKDLAGPTRAADLILKHSIEDACRAGCNFYHLGESGTSTGLAQYKARFGATAHVYEEYVVERLPLARLDRAARTLVKTAIGFEDLT